MDWTAIWLSLKLAALHNGDPVRCRLALGQLVGVNTMAVRIPDRSGRGIAVGSAADGTGLYILMATGPNGVLGQFYEQSTGSRLAFSFPGILLGSVLFNLPFSVRPFTAALERLDRRLIEASWCLGESKWRTFWRIKFPLSWPGILTGIVLTFAHSIGEFGVVLMVGGNIPGVTRTLSISIYDDVQALDYASAAQTSMLLVAFSLAVLALAQVLGRRGWPV
ncbi:MAG: ABC transporter permease subunit [Pirellulaceae bacterium]